MLINTIVLQTVTAVERLDDLVIDEAGIIDNKAEIKGGGEEPMITVGIDVGAKNTKVVVLKDDKEIIGKASVPTGFDQKAAVEEALEKALKEGGISRDQIKHITATGVGRAQVPGAHKSVPEVIADAKAAHFYSPSIRTIVDAGGEESRSVKCEGGMVKDFALNEKCAAGAGTFVEAMARALERSVEEFVELSLKSTRKVPLNAQCVIFAESEVVSLIHANTPHEDIARAIHDALAERVAATTHRVGINPEVALIGGLAKNRAFVESFKRSLNIENIIVPPDPEYGTALGAALIHD